MKTTISQSKKHIVNYPFVKSYLLIDKYDKAVIRSKQNNYKLPFLFKGERTNKENKPFCTEWVIAHTSVIGTSHKLAVPPVPCQDNHAVKDLGNGWGIAIICDGAGSAHSSHVGSDIASKNALSLFDFIVKKNNWINKETLPSEKQWHKISHNAFLRIRMDLEIHANSSAIDVQDLACTIIVVIYSPKGTMVSHIGDGRCGVKYANGKYAAIMQPHSGEEANQTIFLTCDYWLNDDVQVSGVSVPESRIITKPIDAFMLMSDGVEKYSFELGSFDKKKKLFIAKNNPYPGFFDPLIETLKDMKNNRKMSDEQIINKWEYFMNTNKNMQYESDDKTLILGVLNS